MKALLKNQEGAIMILVALFMSVFIGCIAFVTDFGSIYLEKNRLQKIADAAALAGAQELPSNYPKSKQEIDKAIQLNNGNPDDFEVISNDTNTMIEVIGRRKATLFFAKALGIEEPIVEARAKVELQALTAGKKAIPLGIQSSANLAYGTIQTIKVSDSTNGNFGAIGLSGPGAKNYESDLTTGYDAMLEVDTIVKTETGVMAKKTENAIKSRIGSCPDGRYDIYDPDCTRFVLVPVIKPIGEPPIREVEIVGFASFFIESVSSTSDNATVTGRYIKRTYPGEFSADQTDFGTYSFKLTQ